MSSDVWFKRDVTNALLATSHAGHEISIMNDNTSQFLRGYRSAISTMALFFGISPALVMPEESMTMRAIAEKVEE